MAKFYGIGVGPGDSELLTLKAVRVLKELDILYTPEAEKDGGSLALDIAKPHFGEKLEIKYRHFPMSFDKADKESKWESVAREVIVDVKAGKNVGFITLGDPMIYSTYVYIMEKLINQVEVETVAGISSFSNIAASQNLPLVMDKEPLMVIPCTADEALIEDALVKYNCFVLMKVYKKFEMICEKLEKHGLIDYAVLVSNSSQGSEKVYTNLRELGSEEKISYFSTILVNKQYHGKK